MDVWGGGQYSRQTAQEPQDPKVGAYVVCVVRGVASRPVGFQ